MKKNILSIVIVLIMVLSNFMSKAQITFGSNNLGAAGDFCGWSNLGNLFPLRIEHQGGGITQSIDFSTGNPVPLLNMRIWNSSAFNHGRIDMLQTSVVNNDEVLLIDGPIHSNAPIIVGGALPYNTILYGYTPSQGNPGLTPTTDGFRMKYAFNFKGSPSNDSWVFEKTDGNSPVPDGCISFTNTGNTNNEVLSMRIEGNGNVGVGSTFGSGGPLLPPPVARRFEVLENANTDPLVRYSFQQVNLAAAPPQPGIYTDFTATGLGDYIIEPFDNTQVPTPSKNLQERFTGFHTPTPQNTVEINSQYTAATTPNGGPIAPGFGSPTGWAGLRFTKLTSSSIPGS